MNRRIDSLERNFDDPKESCGRQGDSVGPCETFDSSRRREKTFSYDHFLFNVRYCSHSHVTCTPVETIIGGTWWNVLSSICFRCFQTFLYINIHIFWMSFQVVDKKEKKNE